MLLFFLLFALALELCARLDDLIRYGAPFWGNYSDSALRGQGPSGPYNLPSARFEKWRHNSLGFRGPELTAAKPEGITRVVCLGSSESYGLYESGDKEWPMQLRGLLPGRFEVVNASVVGLNLTSFTPYLKARVFPLKPDVVVLVANPLLYLARLEREGRGEKPQPPPPSNSSRMPKLRCLSKIKQVVKQALGNNFPQQLKSYQVRQLQKEIAQIETVRLKGRRPLDRVAHGSLDRYRSDLAALVRLVRSQGGKAVLTTYPTLIAPDTVSKYPDICLDYRRFFVELSFAGMMDAFQRFNEATIQVAREEGAPLVDAASRVPKDIRYFGDNVHYTDEGALLVARAVAEELGTGLSGPGNLRPISKVTRRQ